MEAASQYIVTPWVSKPWVSKEDLILKYRCAPSQARVMLSNQGTATSGGMTEQARQQQQNQHQALSAALPQFEEMLRRSRPASTRPPDAISLFAGELMK